MRVIQKDCVLDKQRAQESDQILQIVATYSERSFTEGIVLKNDECNDEKR